MNLIEAIKTGKDIRHPGGFFTYSKIPGGSRADFDDGWVDNRFMKEVLWSELGNLYFLSEDWEVNNAV